MTEIRNSKSVLVIEYWYLRFNCNLVLGIWDLEMFDYLTNRRLTVYRLPLTVHRLSFIVFTSHQTFVKYRR